jgi:hypothetical protein
MKLRDSLSVEEKRCACANEPESSRDQESDSRHPHGLCVDTLHVGRRSVLQLKVEGEHVGLCVEAVMQEWE